MVLINKSNDYLRYLFTCLEENAKKVGSRVNEEKTEYLVMGRIDSGVVFSYLKVGRYEFSGAKQVRYLHSILTEKNESGKEIASRILSRNKCFYGLTKILGL